MIEQLEQRRLLANPVIDHVSVWDASEAIEYPAFDYQGIQSLPFDQGPNWELSCSVVNPEDVQSIRLTFDGVPEVDNSDYAEYVLNKPTYGTHIVTAQAFAGTNATGASSALLTYHIIWLDGYPQVENTGPTDPEGLDFIDGVLNITSSGTYENFEVTGGISINADNVTLRNFISHENVHTYNGHTGLLMEDGEIIGDGVSLIDGVTGVNDAVLRRLRIHDIHDGIKTGGTGNVLIEDCYIYDIGAGGSHGDGIQGNGGGNVTIQNNRIVVGGSTSCINNVVNWTVDGNWLEGSGKTFYFGSGNEPVITNNIIFGWNYAVAQGWSGGTWEGNVDDEGNPVE